MKVTQTEGSKKKKEREEEERKSKRAQNTIVGKSDLGLGSREEHGLPALRGKVGYDVVEGFFETFWLSWLGWLVGERGW